MGVLLPLFMYHQIAPVDDPAYEPHLYVTPDALRLQIRQIRRAGVDLVTLSEAWRRISEGVSSPRAAVLTFDDLSLRFHRHALPILLAEEATCTVFAIAGAYAGQEVANLDPRLELPSAEDLRHLAQAGIEIGCHSVTHRPLVSLGHRELQTELVDGRRTLEDTLGRPVRTFCHPRGRVSSRVEAACEESGYACACSTLRGNLHQPQERFRLKRIRAHDRRTGLGLRFALSGWYDRANRSRYRRDRTRFEQEDGTAAQDE